MHTKLFAALLLPLSSLHALFLLPQDAYCDPSEMVSGTFSPNAGKTIGEIMSDFQNLSQKKCVPCRGGVPPLKGTLLAQYYKQLGEGWKVIDEHHLEKEYRFPNFVEALAFTNRVGQIAEEQGHHPDIFLTYGKVKIQLWTHKIDGLTESDFIMAAKCDETL